MRFAAVGSLQLIADQQVARSGVLRRQRVDPGPISRAEPTLEVNGPHVIGALRCSKRFAPGRRMASTFPTSHQPCSVQDVPGRAPAQATSPPAPPYAATPPPSSVPSLGRPVLPRSAARILPVASDSGDDEEFGSSLQIPPSHTSGTDPHACTPSCGLSQTADTTIRSSLPLSSIVQ